jgi:hypothetical protein
VLINGDFREDWTVGWQRSVGEDSSGMIVHEVTNSPYGRSGRALHLLYKDDEWGSVWLFQEIPVNHLNYMFRGKFNLGSARSDMPASKSGYSRLSIFFFDGSDEIVGIIQYINCGGGSCGQDSSDTTAVFLLEGGWQTEEINFPQVVPSLLPDMNQREIVKIGIALNAGTQGQNMLDLDSGCIGGCTGELFATDLELIDLTR